MRWRAASATKRLLLKLKKGDAGPVQGGPGFGYLRVHGDDLIVRRSHPSELFRRYDRQTVELYLTESFTFRVLEAGAAVRLAR